MLFSILNFIYNDDDDDKILKFKEFSLFVCLTTLNGLPHEEKNTHTHTVNTRNKEQNLKTFLSRMIMMIEVFS